MEKTRCKWVNPKNLLYINYHDNEWGVPVHDENKLFEDLILEIFQAGLSFETVLQKRESFRSAFDNFDYHKITSYDDKKIEELMSNSNIIRNKNKIKATIQNAKVFLLIQKEFKSFNNYIWSFTNYKTIYEYDMSSSILSDNIAKDLKKRNMKFVGTKIIYAYLQAIGIINSHDKECYKHQ